MTACDLVRVAFDRLDAGDLEGTLELFHPEVVIINPPAIGLGVTVPTHMFGVDELRAAFEGFDLGKIERRIESIEEISPGIVSAHGFISFEGTWGAAQWLAQLTDEGLLNYVEGHLYFRVRKTTRADNASPDSGAGLRPPRDSGVRDRLPAFEAFGDELGAPLIVVSVEDAHVLRIGAHVDAGRSCVEPGRAPIES